MGSNWTIFVVVSVLILGSLGLTGHVFAQGPPTNPGPGGGIIADLQAQADANTSDISILQGLIDIINTTLASIADSITNLQTDLSTETSERQTADTTLQNNIDNISLTPGPEGPQGIPGSEGVGLSCDNQNAIASVVSEFTIDPECVMPPEPEPEPEPEPDCTDFTPGANLSGCDLSPFFDLTHLDLSGANLSGANLQLSSLSFSDLSGANLVGANLKNAQANRVNFSGANLSGANLSILNLADANLSNADLSNTDLTGTFFTGANLSGANLSGADLTDASFRLVDLTGVDFTNTNLQDADPRGQPYVGCIGHPLCV